MEAVGSILSITQSWQASGVGMFNFHILTIVFFCFLTTLFQLADLKKQKLGCFMDMGFDKKPDYTC